MEPWANDNMTRVLQAIPLTQEHFAPFGDVIETKGARHFPINDGAIVRYHDLARIELDAAGRSLISIFECSRVSELPHRITLVERHVLGSQAFIPMVPARMLIVVAPPGDPPTPEQLCAFVSSGEQGINYRSGVWHVPLLAFDKGQRFFVVDRGGPGNNCDEKTFDDGEVLVEWI